MNAWHPDLEQTQDRIEAARKRSIRRAHDEANASVRRPRTSHAKDLLHQLDWLRDEWATDDEYKNAQKVARLRRAIRELLGEPSRAQALEVCRELDRAWIVEGVDHRALIVKLGGIVSSGARRLGYVCDFRYLHPEGGVVVCGIRHGSQEALDLHRVYVHGIETERTAA